jgi:putative SOS response-associated peptidase YedK
VLVISHLPSRSPSFARPFIKRRCLIPADGFYEWRKVPFAIAMKDGRPFTFAGLWENWNHRLQCWLLLVARSSS